MPETAPEMRYLDGPNGRLAYLKQDGAGPGVFWLGGFRSDMTGTKASFLSQWAQRRGRAFVRFDYSGHGSSAGRFEDGAISDWLADARAAFDALTAGPQILVGSSMGAWIAALLALERAEHLAGAVFIAPAPDFTEALMWPSFAREQREAIMREGRIALASEYGAPTPVTRRLIEDARNHLLLGGPIAIRCPVRILQGMGDSDVPWRHALRFAEALETGDLEVSLTKRGDHSLSTPADLERLARAIETVS